MYSLDFSKDDDYQNLDLKKALEGLPVKYLTVIMLRYFEDLKIEEISKILNENPNNVKTRLYKAHNNYFQKRDLKHNKI